MTGTLLTSFLALMVTGIPVAIAMAGSAEIRERFLPRVARGEVVAAIALTEPDAGSDVGAIATRAVRDGGDYLLDGTKIYISNAGIAGIYTMFARTGTVESGRKGLSAFALPADTPEDLIQAILRSRRS